jgi:predicted HTH transcriptional regulator
MNIFILITVLVIGIAVGFYFSSRKKNAGLIGKQVKVKQENKEKILSFLNRNEKVANNDIEKLLGVSDATATRYLEELEQEGKIQQIGTTGHAVFYVLK